MAAPINYENPSPGWSAAGVEPPPEFKASGYVAGYKPPAGFFNWFWTLVSKCISELQTALKTYSAENEADKAAHAGNRANPHGVTKAQVGLGNAEDTADSDKNVLSATKLATARTIRTNLGSTAAAGFDGTASITPGVTGTLPIANGGHAATTAAGALANLGALPTAGGTMSGTLIMNRATVCFGSASNGPGMRSDDNQSWYAYPTTATINAGVWNGQTGGYYTFCPYADNTPYLGTPSLRWKTVYAITGTINTSDRNLKNHIAPLPGNLISRFVSGLSACSYKLNNGDSGRTHYGFIAQDVEALLDELGLTTFDFAGFIKSPRTRRIAAQREEAYTELEPDETGAAREVTKTRTVEAVMDEVVPGEFEYGLRYEEFIPILWRHNQILQQRLDELEKRLEATRGV